jgi:DNA mismatch repair protein MutS
MPNMYEEYLENYVEQTKKFGQKVAIFLMVGIFYEMYDVMNPETGETKTSFSSLIDLLGLKVSVKKGEGPNGLDGLVAGIPDYSVHKWAGKLTQLGWTVVLIEQVKNSQGKVIKRNVERILTPGTHVEAATSADLYITFVSLLESVNAPVLAVTALDLTTGHLHVFETNAQGSKESWTSSDLVQFMELYPPREVLWSVEGSKNFIESMNQTKLKNLLGCQQNTTFYQRSPLNTGAFTNPEFREEFLREHCSLKSLLPTHVALYLAQGSRSETTLISLLLSLKDLWPSLKLGQLLVFPWVPGAIMRMGENALVQLHMIVQETDKQDVLSLLDKTSSPMGRRGLRERLLKPSASSRIIQENLDAVEYWTKKESDNIIKRLKSMTDIDRLYRKIQQGQVQSSDLMNLDTTFKAALWISEHENQNISLIKSIRESVFNIFSVDKVYTSSEDLSLFVKGLVPELDTIEDSIHEQFTQLNTWISERAKSASVGIEVFKPEFREGSLVVKGPRAVIQSLNASNKLPANIVAKINKTGSHLESQDLELIFNKISRLRESLKKKQSIALIEHGTSLSCEIFEPWVQISDWITKIDVNSSLARIAKEYGYVKPTISHGSFEGKLEIEGLRHPLLEAQDRKIPYVQHNVLLGSQQVQGWLLYGLNASGKSSLMRATGLAVLLAQGGSFVPASSMTLAPFSSIHTRIINTDNLWMGLSSFAVEMSEMRDIFRDAGPKSLVLGDELCSGTETTSATALVAAGLKGLLRRKAKFLFATHLHGLSKIEEVSQDPNLKIWHLHVEYDKIKDKLVYHRSLRPGSGSSLYGLEVAKAMRIPDDILEDAIRFRKRLSGEADLSESIGSSWNSSITKIQCTICGLTELSNLEVHHIKERKLANNNILQDGSNVHSQANLVVLCDKCHDKIHDGSIEVGPMIQTSDGMERSVVTTTSVSKQKSKWSTDELTIIQTSIVKFPKLSAAGMSKYLLNQHSIQISVPSLKKICASL